MDDTNFWRELGQQLRVDSIRSSSAAGSGHPTSSMSAADLIAVLLANHLHYDFDKPDDPRNDHLIFSKGHASPLYYSMLKAAGAITDEELLTFRQLGSPLEGHPTPVLPWVDVATGSLGQGLPIGVGVALAGQRLDQIPYRVWILCGDSELAEGSIWEAFEHAAFNKLTNLTAIFDVNRLGQTRETMHGWDLDAYASRATAYGWHAIEIDGHDVAAIDAAYTEAAEARDRPTVIIARTKKGKGAREVEDKEGKHGKPLENPEEAISELGGVRSLHVDVAKPEGDASPRKFAPDGAVAWPRWGPDDKVATRRAYGDALTALGAVRGDVVALDGEVSNSTFSEEFRHAYPDRYFEMFIAEQQMVAAAVGLQVRHYPPVRVYLRGVPLAGVRLHPDGGDQPREDLPGRLTRRRVDRRGRSFADGARGSGRVPRGPFQHRAISVGPQSDGRPRPPHGRPPRDRLHPHHAWRLRDDL